MQQGLVREIDTDDAHKKYCLCLHKTIVQPLLTYKYLGKDVKMAFPIYLLFIQNMKWLVAQSYPSPTFLQTTLRFGEGDESDSCLGIPCVGVAVAPHAPLHHFD